LSLERRLLCTFLCLAFLAVPARANTSSTTSSYGQPLGWLRELLQLSLFSLFTPVLPASLTLNPPVLKSAVPAPPLVAGPCSISPLPPLDDEEAKTFEAAAGTEGVVDRSGLTPATAIALSRFERSVAALGGSVSITSAYRPPAYQAHLQLVWDKEMQLRRNHQSGCAVVRAQVEDEFDRHRLLDSQRPVNFSDHTRGVGFDAAVSPGLRVPIDRVARGAGIFRPDIRRDPVHFRLNGGRILRARR
jgi:hypothetical protein